MVRHCCSMKCRGTYIGLTAFIVTFMFKYLIGSAIMDQRTNIMKNKQENITLKNKHEHITLKNKQENITLTNKQENKITKNQQDITFMYKTTKGDPMPDILVNTNSLPKQVVFIWCGKRYFEFRHYLSVTSVIRQLKPDSIIFYYQHAIKLDKNMYHTWFIELKDMYPFLIERENKALCRNKHKHDTSLTSTTELKKLLTETGGIYVNENVILCTEMFRMSTTQPDNLRLDDALFNAQDPNASDGGFYTLTCPSQQQYTGYDQGCVKTDAKLFPTDIMALDNPFGRLTRLVFYGDDKLIKPKMSTDRKIPNIAHIVWMGGGEMDYLFYLCVLSLVYVVQVETVYIHGDLPPAGNLWKEIKNNSKVKYIYRENPRKVYGFVVNRYDHMSDVVRVDLMVRYGGLYVDTDVICVQPINQLWHKYDAIGCYDWVGYIQPFPYILNLGVTLGKPNTTYWKMVQESMKWFREDIHSWNGLCQPYRIYERNPELMYIDSRLQVLCFRLKCHPTWRKNFQDSSNDHLRDPIDWQKDAFSYHFTSCAPELFSRESILKGNTVLSEMGRFVLQKAGLLKTK